MSEARQPKRTGPQRNRHDEGKGPAHVPVEARGAAKFRPLLVKGWRKDE